MEQKQTPEQKSPEQVNSGIFTSGDLNSQPLPDDLRRARRAELEKLAQENGPGVIPTSVARDIGNIAQFNAQADHDARQQAKRMPANDSEYHQTG